MTRNKVAIIQHDTISQMGISPSTCIDWVEESFSLKPQAVLPPKISIHPQGYDFFNTMPALLPAEYGRFAVKEVHRIEGQEPALGADILLYDSKTGHLLAIMDGDWITTMRTGAVAALAVKMFQKSGVDTYSLMGLGNTARATVLCILEDAKDRHITIRLLKYKNQAESFIQRFKDYSNVTFEIVADADQLVAEADVLISCITAAKGLICEKDELFRPGMLLVPVHTRGFQNCDLFFDKVFGDDYGHIQGFRYFSQFRQFDELTNVLLGLNPGRENDQERILCYNIGLGLHDAFFASHIYDLLVNDIDEVDYITQHKETRKFWI